MQRVHLYICSSLDISLWTKTSLMAIHSCFIGAPKLITTSGIVVFNLLFKGGFLALFWDSS